MGSDGWGMCYSVISNPDVHLLCVQMVGKNRGEDVLACWPNVRGMRSVEDTFGDVLKYLTNAWNGLSSSGV